MFAFLFINSYASFYYLAFIAEQVGDCPVQGCMYTLGINVCIVFGSTLAGSLFTQLVIPYVSYKYRYYCVYRSHRKRGKHYNKKDNDGSTIESSSSSPVNIEERTSYETIPERDYDVEGGDEADRSLSRPEKEHLLTTVRFVWHLSLCTLPFIIYSCYKIISSSDFSVSFSACEEHTLFLLFFIYPSVRSVDVNYQRFLGTGRGIWIFNAICGRPAYCGVVLFGVWNNTGMVLYFN